ncbi:MAG: ASKHA domain-containing protein [Armatimonadota bacterium]
MSDFSITFLPDDRTVRVGDHNTILEAAERAGVYISRTCGGDGICGKCKVIARSGDVWSGPTIHLSREEIQNGYVLACLSYPRSDAVIEIPPESRLEGKPQLADEDATRFGSTGALVGEGLRYSHDPLSQKRLLTLPKPGLSDNLGDLERVYRELRCSEDAPAMQMGLAQLKQLTVVLRDSDWEVSANLGFRGDVTEIIQVEKGSAAARNYGVAVDIGTTTVVAYLVDLNNAKTIGKQATYNSQIQYGEDIISRIMYAGTKEKLVRLSACVADDINKLINGLVDSTGVSLHDITYVVCAGNTTMVHLLLRLDPSAIRLEPYIPVAAAPPVIRAIEAGIKINPRGLLYCVPAVACYVGGDVVAGALISGMTRSPETAMLIDVGTNAEIVLGNQDWMVCCSASAGPTFEGGGISCGMRATNGAIERLEMRAGGKTISYSVIGGGDPIGICGSGLIDTISGMLMNDCLERSGKIVDKCGSGRLREGDDGPEFVLVEAAHTANGKDIVINQADVENFIRSKGAIYHACDCLLDIAGLQFTDLQNIYISGGFGNYLDPGKAITIGLLPDVPLDTFQYMGNGSAQGARMILLSKQARAEGETIAANMTYIELSTSTKFMNEYTSSLFLPHTDIERFPSVKLQLSKVQKEPCKL